MIRDIRLVNYKTLHHVHVHVRIRVVDNKADWDTRAHDMANCNDNMPRYYRSLGIRVRNIDLSIVQQ